MTPSLSHLFVVESLLTEQQELSFLPLPSTTPARGAEVSILGLQLPPPEDTEKWVLWVGKGVAAAHMGSVTQASAAQPGSPAAFETGSELLGSVGDRTSTQVKLLPCYISDAALIQRVGHVRFFFTSPRAEWTGFIHCYS